MVPNDGIIVLGGLIDKSMQKILKKVSSIRRHSDLLEIYSDTRKSRVKRNLMVFMHPLILDSGNQQQVTLDKISGYSNQQLQN